MVTQRSALERGTRRSRRSCAAGLAHAGRVGSCPAIPTTDLRQSTSGRADLELQLPAALATQAASCAVADQYALSNNTSWLRWDRSGTTDASTSGASPAPRVSISGEGSDEPSWRGRRRHRTSVLLFVDGLIVRIAGRRAQPASGPPPHRRHRRPQRQQRAARGLRQFAGHWVQGNRRAGGRRHRTRRNVLFVSDWRVAALIVAGIAGRRRSSGQRARRRRAGAARRVSAG